MTFDLAAILRSKREFRRQLAARPITEKLAMLDALRERALTLGRWRVSGVNHGRAVLPATEGD